MVKFTLISEKAAHELFLACKKKEKNKTCNNARQYRDHNVSTGNS